MQIDDIAKGVVAALLTDQVEGKTILAYRIVGAAGVFGLVGAVLLDGFWRALAVLVLLVALLGLAFIFGTRRLALGLIGRIAPPAELAGARGHFDAAIAEADLPAGPAGFLRLVWIMTIRTRISLFFRESGESFVERIIPEIKSF